MAADRYECAPRLPVQSLPLVLGALLFLLGAAMIATTPLHGADEFQIHLLDVGQGDAMILHQPGTCTALIDAGPLINGHRVTRRLMELEVDVLDLVIVTHPHLDHFGGLFDLLPRIGTKRLYDNGLVNKKWEYFDDYRLLRASHPYEVAARGTIIQCGEVEIEVLHPAPEPDPEDNLNSTSLAMMIRFGDFQLLHMGDLAGDGAEKFLKNPPALEAKVIKIAHHGAADAASQELLDLVSPELALISTGSTNRIGSPHSGVLARLERLGISYLRTDLSGDVVLQVAQGAYKVAPVVSD